MYVVRKQFRNNGEIMLPGSLVEPGNIKWFKTRLKDRVIIEVTDSTFEQWNNYFVGKFGVSLTPAETANAAVQEETKEAAPKVVPENTAVKKETPAKVVAKVVAVKK